MDWDGGRIGKAEHGERTTEPSKRLEGLQAQRCKLHDWQLDSLAEDDLDALVADPIECRSDTIERK